MGNIAQISLKNLTKNKRILHFIKATALLAYVKKIHCTAFTIIYIKNNYFFIVHIYKTIIKKYLNLQLLVSQHLPLF